MDRVTGRTLTRGNAVVPLWGGGEAYPAMLDAIASARRSIGLSSYIFNADSTGRRFVEALGAARRRGVEVRVLVDAIGSHYHRPSIIGALREVGVGAERFLPSILPVYFPYFNLRNHRKILVVDGRVGFTGGMNIDEQFDPAIHPATARNDLHFRLEGPVVATLREVFADDWAFRSGEVLDGDAWADDLREAGPVRARGVIDGPDTNLGRLLLSYIGALDCASESVAIVTPYFLPDAPLIASLNSASLRGLAVDIFVPKANNLALVQWASMDMIRQVLERGGRVWAVPGPFDHSKILTVDRDYALIGSGNWDQRSLRLNFEFNVECHDESLATALRAKVEARRRIAEPITLRDLEARSLPIRLRDGTARLLSPYL
jgi:cardiolipin synthase